MSTHLVIIAMAVGIGAGMLYWKLVAPWAFGEPLRGIFNLSVEHEDNDWRGFVGAWGLVVIFIVSGVGTEFILVWLGY